MDTIHVLLLVWLAGTLSYWAAIAEEERRQVVCASIRIVHSLNVLAISSNR